MNYPKQAIKSVYQKTIYNTIRDIVYEINYKDLDRGIKNLGKSLVDELDDGIKIKGVRIYKKSNDHSSYTLIQQFGKDGKMHLGMQIPSSYPAINDLVTNEEGFIIRNAKNLDMNLESKLGVKEDFLAVRIGEDSEYLLSVNLPYSHNRKEIIYLLKTLSVIVNTKLTAERYKNVLKLASKLQQSTLPKKLDFHGLDISFFAEQAKEVGGDYIDFINLKDKLAFAVGDASGHGFIPAIQMALARRDFIATLKIGDPEKIEDNMLYLNKSISKSKIGEVFITFFYGLIDKEGRLRYSNAGHNPPLIFESSKNNFIELNANGPILGVFPNSTYDVKHTKLNKDDLIALYTDGVIEAKKDKEMFGLDRLKDLIKLNKDKKSKELVEIVKEEIHKFSGKIKTDDITLAIIKKI